jgi:hypothetical protein
VSAAAAAAAVASSGPLLSAAATLGSFPPPGPAPSTAMIANPHLEAGKKRAADNDMLHMVLQTNFEKKNLVLAVAFFWFSFIVFWFLLFFNCMLSDLYFRLDGP